VQSVLIVVVRVGRSPCGFGSNKQDWNIRLGREWNRQARWNYITEELNRHKVLKQRYGRKLLCSPELAYFWSSDDALQLSQASAVVHGSNFGNCLMWRKAQTGACKRLGHFTTGLRPFSSTASVARNVFVHGSRINKVHGREEVVVRKD
jgi:hypothetical protein